MPDFLFPGLTTTLQLYNGCTARVEKTGLDGLCDGFARSMRKNSLIIADHGPGPETLETSVVMLTLNLTRTRVHSRVLAPAAPSLRQINTGATGQANLHIWLTDRKKCRLLELY